jgi:hypothetical protein
MKSIIISTVLAMFAFGCSKKSGSAENCEDVYNHTMSLVPDEARAIAEKGKDKAIAKCEKMSIESRQCALDASNLEDLQKCPRK